MDFRDKMAELRDRNGRKKMGLLLKSGTNMGEEKRNNRERIELGKNGHRRIKARILRPGYNGYQEGEGWSDGCTYMRRASGKNPGCVA
jgi:hypothetical protein